ncbi:hypothetical protein TMM008_05030 [Pseudomonas sp. 008]|nr:hypothetical protein TMM008_05030 [Pseudomonas sp. 008]
MRTKIKTHWLTSLTLTSILAACTSSNQPLDQTRNQTTYTDTVINTNAPTPAHDTTISIDEPPQLTRLSWGK